ncbi:MAG: hypothetical protein JF606_25680 [Burkholderiales bacterium]|nr:hypothetical protein [Burkholderiales bacterium]
MNHARPRKSLTKDGAVFLNFLPATSGKAAKPIRHTVRDWGLKRKTPISLEEIGKRINPVVRGWVVYYGRFYRSALSRVMKQADLHLAKWIARQAQACVRQFGASL